WPGDREPLVRQGEEEVEPCGSRHRRDTAGDAVPGGGNRDHYHHQQEGDVRIRPVRPERQETRRGRERRHQGGRDCGAIPGHIARHLCHLLALCLWGVLFLGTRPEGLGGRGVAAAKDEDASADRPSLRDNPPYVRPASGEVLPPAALAGPDHDLSHLVLPREAGDGPGRIVIFYLVPAG